jgi:primosomal protein N' (replication factor Y)
VPVPIHKMFDYLLPDCAEYANARPGARIAVPFGRYQKTAYLLEIASKTDIAPADLKPVIALLDETPLLSEDDLALLCWLSRYYHHPIGEVVNAAFPVLLRRGGSPGLEPAKAMQQTERGRAASLEDLRRRAPRQAALLDMLNQRSGSLPIAALAGLDWNWRPAVDSLGRKGLVRLVECDPAVQPERSVPLLPEIQLNRAQLDAVASVSAAFGTYKAFLLEGVTGSGKTEVYSRLIQRVLDRDEQAIVLLPEISLTPQLQARFSERLAAPVAVFHSGLTESDRCRAWLDMRHGRASVLLGTRSAVFTPLRRPGLLIVDEEHDPAFKQQEGFRFSARDVAVIRAQRLNIPVVLGSATPSLESQYNAMRRRYHSLFLPQRAGQALPPVFRLIDIRNQPLDEGLSPGLVALIAQTLARSEQILLFLNRRGFAPTLICHACGWVARCPRCDANLVVHANAERLRCHHCNHEKALPKRCQQCGVDDLRRLGLGTERVEKALMRLFPDAGLARVDRDSTRRKGSLENTLGNIHAGTVDILLGTQMLTKGHHFSRVTLVGILDVDAALYSIDYRAHERMAQQIIQVAGRAGREDKTGMVVLQTRHPEHALLRLLIEEGYRSFALAALTERKAANLPPYSHQALLRAEAVDPTAAHRFLTKVAAVAQALSRGRIDILGPVPAPRARRAGRYHYQLLLQCGHRQSLHALLDRLLPECFKLEERRRVRWSLDIDPSDLC